jgi:UrcA family protein
MTTKSLHHFVLLTLMFASAGLAAGPAFAQQTEPRWRPKVESIIVKAGGMKNWHMALTASHLGTAFLVSASIPVPYSDLDFAKEPDAVEMGRRIQVAARLVCQQLDIKYPPTQYPVLEGYSGNDCARMAAKDGMDSVNTIIASAKH